MLLGWIPPKNKDRQKRQSMGMGGLAPAAEEKGGRRDKAERQLAWVSWKQGEKAEADGARIARPSARLSAASARWVLVVHLFRYG